MRIAMSVPVYTAAPRERDRLPYPRVERGQRIPGLTRHGRAGNDSAAYSPPRGASLLPPHRGRFVDVFV